MVSNDKTKLGGMNDKEAHLNRLPMLQTLAKRRQLNYHERQNPQLKKSVRESENA